MSGTVGISPPLHIGPSLVRASAKQRDDMADVSDVLDLVADRREKVLNAESPMGRAAFAYGAVTGLMIEILGELRDIRAQLTHSGDIDT